MRLIKNPLTYIAGILFFVPKLLRVLIFSHIRLDQRQFVLLYEHIEKHGKKLTIKEELPSSSAIPRLFLALCWAKPLVMYLSLEERMLQAGMAGTDTITEVYIPRWQKKILVGILSKEAITKKIPIYLLHEWGPEKVGDFTIPNLINPPYQALEDYADIDHNIERVIKKEKTRTGVILYGPPGNGKSYLIRYFAFRHKLPIYLIVLRPDADNASIIRSFASIQGPAIVVFEDFDNYFNKREKLQHQAKYTFDVFLNVLDGNYNSNEGLIFMMTGNDIEKFDIAIKSRPSRFQIVKEIKNPSTEIIQDILRDAKVDYLSSNDYEFVLEFSLDMILTFADSVKSGVSPTQALKDIKKSFKQAEELRAKELLKYWQSSAPEPVTQNIPVKQ